MTREFNWHTSPISTVGLITDKNIEDILQWDAMDLDEPTEEQLADELEELYDH